MCCKNRRLTDHFPWQKEIAQGQAAASPGTIPAAVQEVTELGNLLVFRSLPGAEYWWARPALPAAATGVAPHKTADLRSPGPLLAHLYLFCRNYFALTPVHLKSESSGDLGVGIYLHRQGTPLCQAARAWALLSTDTAQGPRQQKISPLEFMISNT